MKNTKSWLMAFAMCCIAGSVTNLAYAGHVPKEEVKVCGEMLKMCATDVLTGALEAAEECYGDITCLKGVGGDAKVALAECYVTYNECIDKDNLSRPNSGHGRHQQVGMNQLYNHRKQNSNGGPFGGRF